MKKIILTVIIITTIFVAFVNTAEIPIPQESDWVNRGVVLPAGEVGEWDVRLHGQLSPTDIIKKDGTYYLYYIGADGDRSTDGGPRHRALGVAYSSDGLNFTKYTGNPILTYLPKNNEEEGIFAAGATLDTSGNVVLYYSAMEAATPTSESVDSDIRVAVSSNGLDFTDQGVDVVYHGDSSVWGYGDELFPMGVFHEGGTWYLYYLAKGGLAYWDLALAWGPSITSMPNTTGPVIDCGSEYVKGGCDPIFIDTNKIVMFVERSDSDHVPIRVEAKTALTGSPSVLSASVENYYFSNVYNNAVLYDSDIDKWFYYYTNGSGSAIEVKTAGGPPPEPESFILGEEKLAGSGSHPGITVAPDGSVHVVWVNNGVRYRKYDNGTWEPEEVVDTGAAGYHWPHVAVSGDGDVHVVWEQSPYAAYIWYSRRVSGTWKKLNLWNSSRTCMPRVDVDASNRAHVVFWKDIKIASAIYGRYCRVGLSGGNPVIEKSEDIATFSGARYGDVIVDDSDVVHVFSGQAGEIDHWTVPESGAWSDASSLPQPPIDKFGESIDISLGTSGIFYGATAESGTNPPYEAAFTCTGGGPTAIVWDSVGGDERSHLISAGDKVKAGRGYVVFCGDDNKGRIAAVENDGTIIEAVKFADGTGNQHGGESIARYGNAAVGAPGGGVWLAYQDNRSGGWQIYLRRITVTGGVPEKIVCAAEPSWIDADGASTSLITASICDNGGGVVNTSTNTITFSMTGPGTLTGATVKSPLLGIATIELKSTGTAGTVTMTAEADNLYTGTVDVVMREEPVATSVSVNANPAQVTADGASASVVTAGIMSQYDEIMTGAANTIVFSIAGEGNLLGTTSKPASGGIATIQMESTVTAGTAVVTATSSDLASDTVTVYTVAGAASKVVNTADPAVILDNGVSISTVSAGICDTNGNLVTGAVDWVEFSLNSEDYAVLVGGEAMSLEVSGIWVQTAKAYVTAQVEETDTHYIDRANTITSIPAGYQGMIWIKTANDDKYETANPFLTFDISRDATVYMGIDSRLTSRSWMGGWTNTGDSVYESGGEHYVLYSRSYTAGSVSLGGNEGVTASSMYIVLAEQTDFGDGNYSQAVNGIATIGLQSTTTPGTTVVTATADGLSQGTVEVITGSPGPPASAPSAVQATDGSGIVTLQTTVGSGYGANCKMKVEYSLDGGAGWTNGDPYISGIQSATHGSPSLDNGVEYQITGIDTDSGDNTITFVWDTKSASNGTGTLEDSDENNVRLRVTVNDGANDGIPGINSSFTVDNLDPAVSAQASLASRPDGGDSSVQVSASFVENNPASNTFYIALNGGAYGTGEGGDSGTASPSAQAVNTGVTLDGDDYISKVKCEHVDAYGNAGTNETLSPSLDYVKPYTPPGPTVDNATANSIDVKINRHASEEVGLQYCIYEGVKEGKYVQADGTLNTGEVWQTRTVWGSVSGVDGKITVTGLTEPMGLYCFQSKTRNPGDVSVESEYSEAGGTGGIWEQTTDTDFSAGITSNVVITGTGDIGSIELGSGGGGAFEVTLSNANGGEWEYRKEITVNNTGSQLTDYQVHITEAGINFEGHAQGDLDDVRFTDSGDTELSHWLGTKGGVDGFWVKVPVINNGNTTLYVYYGNALATAVSNIKTTFLFGDDFDDETLDTGQWTWVRESVGNWNEGASRTDWLMMRTLQYMDLYQTGNDAPVLRAQSSITGDIEAIVRIDMNCTVANQQAVLFIYSDDDNYVRCGKLYHSSDYEVAEFGKEISVIWSRERTSETTNDVLCRLVRQGTTYTGYYSTNNGANWTQITQYTGISLVNSYPALAAFAGGIASTEIDAYFDNVRVRKYAGTEPAVSGVGGEETGGTVYILEGTFISANYNSEVTGWDYMQWSENLTGAGTGLKLQVATGDSPGPVDFRGPDGQVTSYYTTSAGEAIWTGHGSDSYIRYKAWLSDDDGDETPKLEDILIVYSVEGSTVTPPADPSGAYLDNVTINSITARWTDNSDDEDGFIVQESSGSGFNTEYTVGADVTFRQVTGLDENVEYSYRVKAQNAAGESGYSNTAAVYTLPVMPDVSCGKTAGTWYGTGNFTFTNEAGFGEGGVGYYRYAWDRTAAHETWTGSESQWTGGVLDSTATLDGSWYLHVKSYNDAGAGNDATADYGPYMYDGTAPDMGIITCKTASDGTIISSSTWQDDRTPYFEWTEPASAAPVEGYRCLVSTDGGEAPSGNFDLTDTSADYSSSPLGHGRHYFSAQARDLAGNEGLVSVFSIWVDTSIPAVKAPYGLVKSEVSEHTVSLSWMGGLGNDGYDVERSSEGETAGYTVIAGGISETSHEDAGLKAGTSYWYRVYGYEGVEKSVEPSNVRDVYTKEVQVVNNDVTDEVISDDNKVTVMIDEDTFKRDVYINIVSTGGAVIETATENEELLGVISGTVKDIKAKDLVGIVIDEFEKDMEIRIGYDRDALEDEGIGEESLRIYVLDEKNEEWDKVSGEQTVNTSEKYVSAKVSHFSVYCLMGAGSEGGLEIRDMINYPNPFSEGTVFSFKLTLNANVELDIFTLSGRLVKRYEVGLLDAGYNEIPEEEKWYGRDKAEILLSDGVYLWRITATSGETTVQKTGKLVIIR